jgi:hypothetical protein
VDKNEFIEMASKDPEIFDALKALKTLDPEIELTPYSYTSTISQEILACASDSEALKKIMLEIRKANDTKIDILKIRAGEEMKEKVQPSLEKFFAAFDNKENGYRLFLLMGETGVGKTYTVTKRYPSIIKYACNRGLDAFGLLFFWGDNGTGTPAMLKTPFHRAVNEGHDVLLDEINALPHDALMLLQGLADKKEDVVFGDQVIKIHPKFRIIGTMNPPSETDERAPLGDAILGRAVGHVMTMTDDLLSERLSVSLRWINSVRRLYNNIANSMLDVRKMDFRDYEKIRDFGIGQLKAKFCVHDARNVEAYERIEETPEYQNLVEKVIENENR